MKRSTQFATVILLAGLVQVSVSGVGLAENSRWKFQTLTDRFTDIQSASVFSAHSNGGRIFFNCKMGKPIDEFLAFAVTASGDRYLEKKIIEVTWRTDKGTVHRENWFRNKSRDGGGVAINGQEAVDFALAVMRAQRRIVFRNPNGTIEFNANGSTNAISQMLEFCGLKQ